MQRHIDKPAQDAIPPFYRGYVAEIEEGELLAALRAEQILLRDMLRTLGEERAEHRYAEGKWSVKELLSHLLDAERVFAFRALCFARGERQALPGFDENEYVASSRADTRSLASLCEELEHLRAATIVMFETFGEAQLDLVGTANDVRISVRALGWVIAGHAAHHRRVIAERYL